MPSLWKADLVEDLEKTNSQAEGGAIQGAEERSVCLESRKQDGKLYELRDRNTGSTDM